MGWAMAIPMIMSAVGGLASSQGGKGAAKAQRKYMEKMFNPQNVNMRSSMLNPWLAQAMGFQGTGSMGANPNRSMAGGGFQGDLNRLASGADLSPYTMNLPYRNLTPQYNTAMQKFQSMIGTSGGQGGLAQAYGLANQQGLANARANTMQQYGLWKEQQRRSDLFGLMDQWRGTQQNAMGLGSQQAGTYQNIPNNMSAIGNAMQGGLAAYGSMGQPGQGGKGAQPQGTAGITTPKSDYSWGGGTQQPTYYGKR